MHDSFRHRWLLVATVAVGPWVYLGSAAPPIVEQSRFEVVIAGGSTAALAAALASAGAGARTALLEPTDWIGGQLTASAVPAIDEAWHRIPSTVSPGRELNVAAIARDPRNITPSFREMLETMGDRGNGWVSRYCFPPLVLLREHLEPRAAAVGDRLTIFRNTVVKNVEAANGRVTALVAIERVPHPEVPDAGYDRLLSEQLGDWYSPLESVRYTKRILRFGRGPAKSPPVFIDATEWGEVLVLSGASYLQGAETTEGSREGNDRSGQSITYDFVQRYHATPQREQVKHAAVQHLGYGAYRDRADAWERIWTYRRIFGKAEPPSVGDLSLQNWGYSIEANEGGNDYPFGYVLLDRAATNQLRNDWQGGVDLQVLSAAEQRALAWHTWFRDHAPATVGPQRITLARDILGTGHGLSKLPYIRDTRRSVGIGGFILTIGDLNGPAEQLTGTKFPDRIALGAYPADIHPLVSYEYPAYLERDHPTLPFYIPFRALTSESYGNLLVAGKTMAQSFLSNSATRLHPIEWSSGTAAGIAAADMATSGESSTQLLQRIESLQSRVTTQTPIDWTISPEHMPRESGPSE